MQANKKDKTAKNIYGKWHYQNTTNNIIILITKEDVSLNVDLNPSITFSSTCEWTDDFLIFTDAKRKYFIKHADNKSLIFGAFVQSANIKLEVNWEIETLRVKF